MYRIVSEDKLAYAAVQQNPKSQWLPKGSVYFLFSLHAQCGLVEGSALANYFHCGFLDWQNRVHLEHHW